MPAQGYPGRAKFVYGEIICEAVGRTAKDSLPSGDGLPAMLLFLFPFFVNAPTSFRRHQVALVIPPSIIGEEAAAAAAFDYSGTRGGTILGAITSMQEHRKNPPEN